MIVLLKKCTERGAESNSKGTGEANTLRLEGGKL